MKKNDRAFYLTAILAVLIAAFVTSSGCSGKSAPTRIYLLTSGADPITPVVYNMEDNRITVGISSVEMPPYLDRPQIVTRMGSNRLNISEFDNWGEPLEETVYRLVLGNLSTRLYSEKIAVLPWKGRFDMDYQVTLTVTRLDNTPASEAILEVRWALLEGDKQLISTRRSVYISPSDSLDYEVFAAAHSQNVDLLCKDIAQTIKHQVKAP